MALKFKPLTKKADSSSPRIIISRPWKELRNNWRLLGIDLALLATALLLIFTNEKEFFSYLIFVLLIYGMFFWSLLAFFYRAGFWVSVVSVVRVSNFFYGEVGPTQPAEEIFELLLFAFVLVMVSVIARRRMVAEKRVRASDKQHRRLVDLAFESAIIVADERFIFVNAQAADLFHVNSRAELVGEQVSKFLDPVSCEQFMALVTHALDGGGEIPLTETLFTLPDDTTVVVEMTGVVIVYQGQPAVHFVLRNVTERKQVEAALQASNTKFQGILESAPDAVLVTDEDGAIILVNAQAEVMFGYSRQELLGTFIEQLLPEHVRKKHVKHRMNYRSRPSFRQMGINLKLAGRRKDGSEFPVDVKLSPMMIEEVLTVTVVVRDITERKQAEQQLIRTERLAILGQATAALAHELNNPLQIIQGYLDMVLDFPLDLEERDAYLRIIRGQIERLHEATRNILNYTRPQPESRRPVVLEDVVKQVLTLTDQQLQQSGVHVETNFQDAFPVMAVPDQLTQVFLNLVINAIESTDKDSGLLRIEIKQVDQKVSVTFKTNSSPISLRDLPHIFEPFYTTKPDGSGLGLWISHNLVKQCAGTLTAENLADDQGVVFTATFPQWIPEKKEHVVAAA